MRDPRLESLADYVRETRKRKNLNQALIRQRGGPSSGWLGELESGSMMSMPKPATLKKLALGLNEPLEDVLKAAGVVNPADTQSVAPKLLSLLQKSGFMGTVNLLKLQISGDFVSLLRGFVEYHSEGLEDREWRGPMDDVYEIAVILLDVLDGRRGPELDAGEQRTLEHAMWPEPESSVYKFRSFKKDDSLNWLGDELKPGYKRVAFEIAGTSDYILEVSGDFLEIFGYPEFTWLFLDTNIGDIQLDGHVVLALIDNEFWIGRHKSDDRGIYIETNAPGKTWRKAIKEGDQVIAEVNGSFTPNNLGYMIPF